MLNLAAATTPLPNPLRRKHAPAAVDEGKQIIWEYGGDMRFFLVVGEVAIVQMMHPAFSAVVADNSVFYADVWRRWFERTQPMLQKMVFDEDATAIAKQVRDIHTDLKGHDDKGRHWHALNPYVFFFAHATQYYAVHRQIEIFHGRELTAEESDSYYQATCELWRQFGMRDDILPSDWPTFLEFMDSFYAEHLENTPGAHEMIEFLRSSPPPPLWFVPDGPWRKVMGPVFDGYVRVQLGLLPPVAREILGLPEWTDTDEQWLRKVGRRVGFVMNNTPASIWQSPEARAGHFKHNRTLRGLADYLIGEAVQRPIITIWRAAT